MKMAEPRFRVLCGLNARALWRQVRECEAEGWLKLGGEAVAVPTDQTRPPYLCQTMYFPAPVAEHAVSLAERLEGHTAPIMLPNGTSGPSPLVEY